MRILLTAILCLVFPPSLHQTVTFHFLKNTDDGLWIQPVLPVQFRVSRVSGNPQGIDFARCKVYNGKDDPEVRVECGGAIYKITGFGFEADQ